MSYTRNLREQEKKAHPWRICPIGKHFVREHTVHMTPSKKHPEGKTSVWHEHCANNPSHKDELSFHEIEFITQKYFSSLEDPQIPGLLTKIFSASNSFPIFFYIISYEHNNGYFRLIVPVNIL